MVINKLKRAAKSLVRGMMESRTEHAYFYVADRIRHEYPANTSLHEIVKDLRKKNGEF